MDEDTAIINSNTRNEKIKNFFINNKKLLISTIILIITLLISYFAFAEYNSDVITKNTSPAPIVSSTFSEIKAGVCNIFDFK